MGGIAIFASSPWVHGLKPAKRSQGQDFGEIDRLLGALGEREIGDDVVEMLGHRRRGPLAEALVGLGLATSKLGPNARPLPKTFTGAFAGLSARWG